MQGAKIASSHLDREVHIEWTDTRPEGNREHPARLLVFNDGQEAQAFSMEVTLRDFTAGGKNPGILALAIHAGERRQEYGIGRESDFAKRGSRAIAYSRFIKEEFLPWVQQAFDFGSGPELRAMAGFSLGALSAFDLVWNHPGCFSAAGLFSGSFWWRARDLDEGYQPGDRIAHRMVKETPAPAGARFWFQTGLMDETADRDRDGLIDSVGDTLDLILEMEKKGFRPGHEVEYTEMSNGRHDFKTMARALPDFLEWWCRRP
jgi:enterochelin esterase family protein